MQTTHRGGLAGKARNSRHRRRVERIHAQQMLDEYFREDDEVGTVRLRHVPVRGRADFLPTIDSWSREDEAFDTANQLELTLKGHPIEVYSERCETSKMHPLESEPFEVATVAEPDETKTSIAKVIPVPYWARPRASFQPEGGRGVARAFELRRFAYGCAMGSAAAAAILLVASVVFN